MKARQRLLNHPVIVPVLSLLAGVILWYIIEQLDVLNPVFFAGPYKVGKAFVNLVSSGMLWSHLKVTAVEFAVGFGAAGLLGTLMGHWLARNRTLEVMFSPYLIGLYSAPRVAFIMIVLAWFGHGFLAKGLLVFLGAFFPVVMNVLAGAKLVLPEYFKAARVFGATPLETFAKVIFPSTMPYMFVGLRLAVGRAMVGVFVAEMYGSGLGIGAMIQQAGAETNAAVVIVGIIILAVLSVLLTEMIRFISDRMMPWQQNSEI